MIRVIRIRDGKVVSQIRDKKTPVVRMRETDVLGDRCVIKNCDKKREHSDKSPFATPYCCYHFDVIVRRMNK